MASLSEKIYFPPARGDIVHMRPTRWLDQDTPDPDSYEVIWEETVYNVKTTVGIDFMFLQVYGTSGLGANGLNYVAVSNDTVSETSASTTLTNEIVANGLSRAQGTYAHSVGASTATIAKTFTCTTTSQAAQKAALFSAASVGTMHHVLAFTQRTLQVGDTLSITFTITLA